MPGETHPPCFTCPVDCRVHWPGERGALPPLPKPLVYLPRTHAGRCPINQNPMASPPSTSPNPGRRARLVSTRWSSRGPAEPSQQAPFAHSAANNSGHWPWAGKLATVEYVLSPSRVGPPGGLLAVTAALSCNLPRSGCKMAPGNSNSYQRPQFAGDRGRGRGWRARSSVSHQLSVVGGPWGTWSGSRGGRRTMILRFPRQKDVARPARTSGSSGGAVTGVSAGGADRGRGCPSWADELVEGRRSACRGCWSAGGGMTSSC